MQHSRNPDHPSSMQLSKGIPLHETQLTYADSVVAYSLILET
jgi:hypothetical protein